VSSGDHSYPRHQSDWITTGQQFTYVGSANLLPAYQLVEVIWDVGKSTFNFPSPSLKYEPMRLGAYHPIHPDQMPGHSFSQPLLIHTVYAANDTNTWTNQSIAVELIFSITSLRLPIDPIEIKPRTARTHTFNSRIVLCTILLFRFHRQLLIRANT